MPRYWTVLNLSSNAAYRVPTLLLCFPVNYRSVSLMGGQHQHFSYLHVGRSLGSIETHVGDVVTRQGFDAFVDIIGSLLVAMETGTAEVGLHQTRLHIGNA